jgi:hypothetical protein
VIIALGTLTVPDRAALRRWVMSGLIADAADLTLTVAARDRLPRRGSALVSAIAGGGVALGVAAVVQLGSE